MHFLKEFLKGKVWARKLVTHHYRSLDAATPIRFTIVQLQKKDNSITHAAAATKQPWSSHYNAICRPRNYPQRCRKLQLQNRMSTPKQKKDDFDALFKRIFKRKSMSAKISNTSLSQPGCSHSNTIYDRQLQKTIVLHMQRRQPATLKHPLQCDLQPRLQETHRTTHTGTTIVAKHIEGTKRPQPHPPHTRGTFHRRLQPLYTEKHKVSCSGFLPTTHSMQHSCTHSNAIRNHSFKKRIELRTQEQPLLQNT